MTTTYLITLANEEEFTVVLTISQPSYYAHEYAYKLAEQRHSEVSTVVVIK
jgi:translation initiation factor 2B subunit (eIF-2B alpha/beta/delta family)